jgi:hypothetical protein
MDRTQEVWAREILGMDLETELNYFWTRTVRLFT